MMRNMIESVIEVRPRYRFYGGLLCLRTHADCASAPAIQTLGLHQNSRSGNKFTRELVDSNPHAA